MLLLYCIVKTNKAKPSVKKIKFLKPKNEWVWGLGMGLGTTPKPKPKTHSYFGCHSLPVDGSIAYKKF